MLDKPYPKILARTANKVVSRWISLREMQNGGNVRKREHLIVSQIMQEQDASVGYAY